jgi:hypothetical protein
VKYARTLSGALVVVAAATTLFAVTNADAASQPRGVALADEPWTVLNRAPGKAPLRKRDKAAAADLPGATKIVRDGITLLHLRTPVNATPVTGTGATRSDYDGDGRDDIAAFSDSGVVVTYSSAPHRDQLSTELSVRGGCTCFGWNMTAGNFNGDRYDDLAVGDHFEADVRQQGRYAGAVWIFSGGPGGLQVDAVKHINQSTDGVPGTPAEGDWFGAGLAAGDVTGDGKDDLAVGIPLKTIGGRKEAGAVALFRGSAAGVLTRSVLWIDQSSARVPGVAETRDHFGASVAIGAINKDKPLDLVVGAPQEDDGAPVSNGRFGNGLITQFWGSTAGLSLNKVTSVSGQSATASANLGGDTSLWEIGGQLAIGDTNGDGYGEVLDGSSGAEVDGEIYPGALVSLPGRGTGLSAKGIIVLSEDSAGVPGYTMSDDRFADSIAVGDVTGDGLSDVLVGVPGDEVAKRNDAGTAVLLRGSRKGLTGVGSQLIYQSSAGVPDSPEVNDRFGTAVALLNLNGTGGLDAVIGASGESVAGDQPGWTSGTVTRLVGGPKGLAAGTLLNGRRLGVPEARYGYHLAHP